MTGLILCNKCRKKMDGICHCTPKGNAKCIVKVYYKGKNYEYRRDSEGDVLTYDKALNKLLKISNAIKDHTFNPIDYTDEKIKERKFENQIDLWLQRKEKQESLNELSPGTMKDYRGYVKNYYHFFSGLDVREITLEHLEKFKDSLDNVSIKTRKNILNALRSFFFWLKRRETIKALPNFPEVKGDDSHARQAIDVELQEDILIKIPEAHRDIIEFLMETGLRPGEACALLVEHINLNAGTARIERTFSGNKLRETTKQKKKRTIPLSARAYEIANKHAENKLPKQFLFINSYTKRHYQPDTLWRIWKENSGLENITLYEGTRHSFGSQLIQNNDVVFVKELMGHSSIQTTEKYLHMRMTKLHDVVNSRKVVRLENRTKIEPNFAGYESNKIN